MTANLKSHAIYAALRERILCNDIAPGTRLVMRDVANQYEASASRTPSSRTSTC
jgi:DNA-binding GntR family transcriptional regulator